MEHKKITIRGSAAEKTVKTTFFLLFSAFLFILVLNLYSYVTFLRISKIYTVIRNASENIKSKAINANLVFIEIASGATNKDMNSIWTDLDSAGAEAKEISELEPQNNIGGMLASYRGAILELHLAITEKKDKDTVDQARSAYEGSYSKLNDMILNTEQSLNRSVSKKMFAVKAVYVTLIVCLVLIFTITGFIIRNFSLKMVELDKENMNARSELKGIIDAMDSILFFVSIEQTITLWNKSAETHFNIPATQAVNRNVMEILPFFQNYKTPFHKVLQTKKIQEFRKQEVTIDGNNRIFDMKISFSLIADGIVIMMEDITLREAMGKQIEQEQKTQVVKNMIQNLTGSFSNVLEQITTTVGLLELSSEGKTLEFDVLKKNVHLIESCAEKAYVTVQELMRFSEHRKINPVVLNLNDLVQHVLEISRDIFDDSIDISFQNYDLPAQIQADPALLEIALMNMCENAEHAMTFMRQQDEISAGVMEVSIEKIYPDRTYRQIHPLAMASSYWTISIADNGVGIEGSILANIFDPFFTTKINLKSVGLGLTVAEEIIHQHDGFIEVYSQLGQGTNFIIYLPDKS